MPVLPALTSLEKVVEAQAKLLQEKDVVLQAQAKQIEKLETTVAALQQNIKSLNEKFSIWTTALQPVIDKVEKGEEF